MNMMTALAAVSTVTVPTVASASDFDPDRRAWDAAMAALNRVAAEDDAFNRVYARIEERFSAEVAKLPPHTDHWNLAWARRAVRDFDEGRVSVEPYARPDFEKRLIEYREIVATDDERKARIDEINDRTGHRAAEKRWEELGELRYEAEWTLMEIPAPDQVAVLWKLEKLLSVENGSTSSWSASAVEKTMEDARRLLAA